MIGCQARFAGCAIVLTALGWSYLAECKGASELVKTAPPSSYDHSWSGAVSNGPYEESNVYEGSGGADNLDVDDTAPGFGPDDEDSYVASGSPVDFAPSSGEHEEPVDYDDYPRTTWLESDETGVSLTAATGIVTTETVPNVDWHITEKSTVWPEGPDGHHVFISKTPTEEDVWTTSSSTESTPALGIFTSTTSGVTVSPTPELTNIFGSRKIGNFESLWKPGTLAAIIGGSVLGLLAAIILITFVVYRLRKKDEGSYALDESKTPPAYPYAYHKAPTREFYA